MLVARVLDASPAGVPRVPLLVAPPIPKGRHSQEQPQQRDDQVNPYCVLHALHAAVALWVFVDVHLAKNTEQRNGQDEQHQVPYPDEREADDEGHEVEHGRDGSQRAHYDREYPFRILVDAMLASVGEILAIEAADGEAQGELDEVEEGEGDVRDGEAEDVGHFDS